MARDPPASNFPGDLAQNQAPAGVYSYHVGAIDASLGPRGYAQRTHAYACRAGTDTPFAFGGQVEFSKQAVFRAYEDDQLGTGGDPARTAGKSSGTISIAARRARISVSAVERNRITGSPEWGRVGGRRRR